MHHGGELGSQVLTVTIQSEFNAKVQRCKDAKLMQGNPTSGGPAACAHQMVTAKTAS
jgi:hypothetical protein